MFNDRFGLFPLYYARVPGGLAFGSGVRAVLAHPSVDRSVDPVAINQFLVYDHLLEEALQEIARDHSVVVVEHDMEFIKALSCHVTVLHEGSVLAEGSLESLQSNEAVIEVYLGR